MKEEKYYPIIKVVLGINDLDKEVIGRKENGEPIFSKEFSEKLDAKTNWFKEQLDERIHQLNIENPFIHFTEIGKSDKEIWSVFIRANDAPSELWIMGVIEMAIPNMILYFRYYNVV